MNLSRVRPALASAATAALLVGGVSACGDRSSSDAAAVDLPSEGETVAPDDFVDWMQDGIERSTTAQVSTSTDYGMGPIEAEGQVDYSQDPVEMAMTVSGGAATGGTGSGGMGGDDVEVRLVDGVMYMDLGSMSNGKFVKFDLDDPGKLPPGMAAMGDQMDPLAAFEEMGDAVQEVVYVGSEDVDGDDLDHFTVTLDTSAVDSLADLPAEAQVPETIDYDIWFDDEFRMRQLEMSVQMATPVDVEAHLDDWGSEVDITAPDPEDVTDAPVTGGGY